MKKKYLNILAPLLLIIIFNFVFVPSSALAQGNAFHWRYAGKGADATWETCNEITCNYQSVYVAQTMYRENGTKFNGTTLSYYQSNYDANTNTYQYTYGYLENPTFSINNKLNSAQVKGTVSLTVCTYNYETGEEACVAGGTAVIDLTWTGNGDLFKGSFKSHTVSKNITSNYSYKGSWRSAVATGMINGQSTGPSSWATIFDYKDASVSVCHGSC